MIAVVVLAILAAIAYPLYTNYVEKSRRASAVTALLRAASLEEKHFAIHNTYATLDQIGYASAAVTVPSPQEAWYTLTADGISTTGFTLKATPTGVQVDDDCSTFTLDATGARGVTGTESTADCWGSG